MILKAFNPCECEELQQRLAVAKLNEQATHEANKRMAQQLFKTEKQRDELLAASIEYLAAADNSVNPQDGDDVAAMIRFGEAEKDLRAAIAKARG